MVATYVSCCVLVPALLVHPGAAADQLLAGIAAGDTLATAALLEADGGYDLHRVATCAKREREGWRLSGAKVQVKDGADADWFVVSAIRR